MLLFLGPLPPLFLKQLSGVCCFPSHDYSKFQCLTQTFHHSTCLSYKSLIYTTLTMKLSCFPITVFLLLVTGARGLPYPHTQLVLKSQQVSFQRLWFTSHFINPSVLHRCHHFFLHHCICFLTSSSASHLRSNWCLKKCKSDHIIPF